MCYVNYKTFIKYRDTVFLLTLIFVVFFISGCTNYVTNNKESHPEHFDAIFKTVDTTDADKKDYALRFLDSAYNAFPNPGIFDEYAKDSLKADIASYVYQDWWKAILYTDSMRMLVEGRINEEEFAERYVRALYLKAGYLAEFRRYEEAIKYYSLAKQEELSHVKNNCNLSDCVGGQGDLLSHQGKHLEAARSYLKDYEFESGCWKGTYKEVMAMQKSLTYTGISYQYIGMLDSAGFFYRQALKVIADNEHKFPDNYKSTKNAKGNIYADNAALFAMKNQHDSVEELYKKSVEETKNIDFFFSKKTQMSLASFYINNHQFQKADSLLDEIKIFLDSAKDTDDLVNWYWFKSKCYYKQNQPGLAFTNLKKYVDISDSLDEKNKALYLTNINKTFSEIEQSYATDILKKDNKTKNASLAIAILSFSFLSVILIAVWDNLNRTRKHALKLNKVNKQITENHQELQHAFQSLEQSHEANSKILKVVAHDLKNPISAIRNLIYVLLKKDPTEEQKRFIVREKRIFACQ